MLISKLKMASPFQDLFPVDAKVLSAVTEDMRSCGYDQAQPVVIWKGKNVVIDGHTRVMAAQQAEVSEIPVEAKEFADDDEALAYAIHNQRDRRNMTDGDILRCVEVLDRRKPKGGDRKSRGAQSITSTEVIDKRSSKDTATVIGTSPAKVERARTVLDHADPETKREVLSGEKTINRAYKETQEARREQKTAEFIALAEWKKLPSWEALSETAASIEGKHPPPTFAKGFNSTNEKIEWAKWSWNPVTGCHGGCEYCYARDIANRFYSCNFEPAIYPVRLWGPVVQMVPKDFSNTNGLQNVFVCSMADLFGDWVPQDWIDPIIRVVRASPQWNFLFLTKNPARLVDIEWPDNAWVGTTVDVQDRVQAAEEAFSEIAAKVKFLSCEPMRERLTFKKLSVFDWIIIGGQSQSSQMPAAQPEWEWVESLMIQAREADCKIYFKPNLIVRPKEYPT